MQKLRTALLDWYAQHRRELPWRENTDPYRVWVSEIMLQQTRVAAVLEHYQAFMQAFPSVQALASAGEDEVLTRWSGLGYYRRARLLHRAAQVVTSELGGEMPSDAKRLQELPGVGRYTAAAIASIAYGEAVAVVDGNVERVLTRMDGPVHDATAVWRRAQELLDPGNAGDWNQAMMELGATVCTPQNPQCLTCPVQSWCSAPGTETRKPQAPRKRVQVTRALVERRGSVFLVQRAAHESKMANMWELPEWDVTSADAAKCLMTVRHSITDTDYEVLLVSAAFADLCRGEKINGCWASADEIANLPVTGLTRKILRKLGRL